MELVIHRKGKRLPDLKMVLKGLFYSLFPNKITIEFVEDSKYDIETQSQWNKIYGRGGIWYDFKNKVHRDSKMLVWRYNKKTDLFQIAEYERNDYEFSYNVTHSIEANQRVTIRPKFKGIKPLSFYFGGRSTPNKTIYYLIKFN